MAAGRRSLFIFLMGLAWRSRFSVPLLLGSGMALLSRTWLFHIRLQAIHRINDRQVVYIDEGYDYMVSDDDDDDDDTWEEDSDDSWETIVEEVAFE